MLPHPSVLHIHNICSSLVCLYLSNMRIPCGNVILFKHVLLSSIYVRENGIEWNSPSMQPAKGTCCGQSCTELAVMDNITVLYFDDINFDDVRNDTRCCNTCMTFCCGGRGEQVQIESTFCFSCCIRGRDNRTCIPVCCPDLCCPCIVKSELWVEDAPAAVKIIRDARDDAKRRLGLDD